MLLEKPTPTLRESRAVVLETDRLVLRQPTLADVKAIARVVGDKRVSINLRRVPHPYSAEDAISFVTTIAATIDTAELLLRTPCSARAKSSRLASTRSILDEATDSLRSSTRYPLSRSYSSCKALVSSCRRWRLNTARRCIAVRFVFQVSARQARHQRQIQAASAGSRLGRTRTGACRLNSMRITFHGMPGAAQGVT